MMMMMIIIVIDHHQVGTRRAAVLISSLFSNFIRPDADNSRRRRWWGSSAPIKFVCVSDKLGRQSPLKYPLDSMTDYSIPPKSTLESPYQPRDAVGWSVGRLNSAPLSRFRDSPTAPSSSSSSSCLVTLMSVVGGWEEEAVQLK